MITNYVTYSPLPYKCLIMCSYYKVFCFISFCSMFECSPFSEMLKPYEQHCFLIRSHYFLCWYFFSPFHYDCALNNVKFAISIFLLYNRPSAYNLCINVHMYTSRQLCIDFSLYKLASQLVTWCAWIYGRHFCFCFFCHLTGISS